MSFAGSVDGGHALTSNATVATTFGGPVGAATPLTAITVANAAQVNGGQVSTTGAQAWGGPVTLGAATTASGSNLSFASTVDGPGGRSPPRRPARSASPRTSVPPHRWPRLSATAAGGTTVAGAVRTTGTQSFTGPVTLAGDVTASGSSITFNGAVDGAHALQVDATSTTTFASPVGATTALTSLSTDAAGSTRLGGQRANDRRADLPRRHHADRRSPRSRAAR